MPFLGLGGLEKLKTNDHINLITQFI
ncbi:MULTISPECIES: hypothetical protein [Bacillus]|nr:hypothetical protein [Bacillus sp. TH12]MBK5506075.1 hypothetical protein [Bacillus sp. TH12]